MILLARELLIRLIASIKTHNLKILADKVFILLLGTTSGAARSYFIQHILIRIQITPRSLKKRKVLGKS